LGDEQAPKAARGSGAAFGLGAGMGWIGFVHASHVSNIFGRA